MTLQSINIFLRVVREGSFSRAGRSLGLSATAISRHINALEADLGAPLLHRSSRKLSVTEVGRDYYHRIKPLIEGMRDAAEAVKMANAQPRGVLRVHCRTTVGTIVVAPATPRFLAAHPDIHLTMLLSNETAVDMVGGDFDVDIQVGERPDSALRARMLTRSDSVLCAAPKYLRDRVPMQRPGDLARENCLIYHYGNSQSPPAWMFSDTSGISQSVAVQGSLRTDNGVILLAALRDGLGVAVAPRWAVVEDLAEGHLIELLPEFQARQSAAGTAVYAVFHANRHESAKVRLFIDFLASLFGSQKLSQ
jgi:DNA-binding transcriptional LysR family regulator